MKKKSEFVKMRVMDMLNGNEIGKVQNIVIHPDTKAVVLLLNVGPITDFHMLKRDQIIGIKNFIMVKTPNAVLSTKDDKEAYEELSQYYDIMGLEVIAEDGSILGEVKDISIDEENFTLMDVILDNGIRFSKNEIFSISNEYMFVKNPAISYLEKIDNEDNGEVMVDLDEAAELILGRKLIGDVSSADGAFTCEAGSVITKEIIAEAKDHDAFADLIINVEE